MRAAFNRRTATRVKDGRVRRKNRNRPTARDGWILHRESPGHGFCHVASKEDIRAFVEIIPDWERYSERLERIVLAKANGDCDGAHEFFHREETGAIYLHAWNEELWTDLSPNYFESHKSIFELLGVSFDPGHDLVLCRFTPAQAKAFVLLHVFMHELGHHYDRILQKHLDSCKGEEYAERFAARHLKELFPKYVRVFGDPRFSS